MTDEGRVARALCVADGNDREAMIEVGGETVSNRDESIDLRPTNVSAGHVRLV